MGLIRAMTGMSQQESDVLDQYIDIVLQSFQDGTIDQTEARDSLKKTFALAAAGNPSTAFFLESEIRAILDQGGRESDR